MHRRFILVAILLLAASYAMSQASSPLLSTSADQKLKQLRFTRSALYFPFLSTTWIKEIENLPTPTAYWPFHEGGDTAIEDIIGGYDLTMSNAAGWSTKGPPLSRHSLLCEETSGDYTTTYYASISGAPVMAGGAFDLQGVTNATWIFWVFPRSIGEGGYGRFWEGCGVYVFFENVDEIKLGLSGSTGLKYAGTNTSPFSAWNQWYFVALLYDGTQPLGSRKSCYVGDLAGNLTEQIFTEDTIGPSLARAQVPIYIGDRAANDRAFDGWQDHIACWYGTTLTRNQLHLWQRLTGGIIQGAAARH